jgi:hypothetical protein
MVCAPGTSRQNPVLPETRVWIGFSPGNGERPAVVDGGQYQRSLLSPELQSHKSTAPPLTAPFRASRHRPVPMFSNL